MLSLRKDPLLKLNLIALETTRLFYFTRNHSDRQGVISRGLRGAESPLLKFLLILGELSKLSHWLGFSEFIGFASKVL